MADFGHAKLGNPALCTVAHLFLELSSLFPKNLGNLAVQFREAFITFLVLEQNIDHASRERAESVTRYLSTVCLREALWASEGSFFYQHLSRLLELCCSTVL